MASPSKVAVQAATEIHSIACDIARKGGKSAASESRMLASEYIPRGNTIPQSIGVYVRGTRQTPCFQIPKRTNRGSTKSPMPTR